VVASFRAPAGNATGGGDLDPAGQIILHSGSDVWLAANVSRTFSSNGTRTTTTFICHCKSAEEGAGHTLGAMPTASRGLQVITAS